jgi:hypothetical protein
VFQIVQVYEEEQVQVMHCSLVVTKHHLVTCLERLPGCGQVRTLARAAIQDLTAFTVDPVGHSWCVLVSCSSYHYLAFSSITVCYKVY